MPNPKRRHSAQRRDKRRTHDKDKVTPTVACSNCGSPVRSHHVCPSCGHYRGRKVIEKESI